MTKISLIFTATIAIFQIAGCGNDSGTNPETISFNQTAQSSGNSDFISDHFSGSGNCSKCHNDIRDKNLKDVSIITDWSSSMMANSARDPFWQAKVRSEINRTPSLENLINDKCTRCHAPMANEAIKKLDQTISVFSEGILDSSNNYHDEAMDGVSCTLCHQISNTATLGSNVSFSGGFDINDSKYIYGPFDNPITAPMVNQTGYTPVYSSHIRESKVCATCHELKTPYVDAEGTLLSKTSDDEFPEQTPYSEWLNSDYKDQKSCQSCHLSRTDGVIIASRPTTISTLRNDFAIHDFIGANKMMLNILDKYRDQLGVISNNFAETIHKTENMLAGSSEIKLEQSTLMNGILTFDLKISSNTGHKLPTSYPSRRIIVHTRITDSRGKVIFESGRVNDNGSVEYLDSDENPLSFEPHYRQITSAEQVQVYESIMANSDDQVTYTLLRAKEYKKDNRILPNGFDKQSAGKDIAVKGIAFTDDDFIAGSDQLQYQISGLNDEQYKVEVELLYQAIGYAFAQDLFKETDAVVSDFKKMYDASDFKAVRMAAIEFTAQ